MKEKRNGKTRFQRHCREKSIKLRGFEFLKFSQKRVLLYFRNHRESFSLQTKLLFVLYSVIRFAGL